MKKKVYGLLMTVIMIICVVCGTVTAFSCKDKEKEVTEGPEAGVYYYDAGNEEYTLTLNAGNTFTFVKGIENQGGTYKVNNKTQVITLTFAKDKKVATATLAENALDVTYDGTTAKYLKKIYYTVSYNTNGGSELQAVQVINGKTSHKPTEDPTKEGFVFIGWYKDAEMKEAFNFDGTAIFADTTVYAGWAEHEVGQKEYKVTYVVDGAVFAEAQTIGNVVYNLPTPEKDGFVGWWMSDYEDADKLTAQYVDQELTQDVTLYAVFGAAGDLFASVDENGVKWNNVGTTYNVEVVDPEGDSTTKANIDGTSYKDYKFTLAGDYVIKVTTGKKTATVYYKYNALDRVSSFNVINGSILVFSPVEGAEAYYITVLCGNEDHKHTEVFNGTSTNFEFANCDMRKGGIVFTVTAKANGMADSVSTYVYNQELEAVTGLKIDDEYVSWNPVANALGYELTINGAKIVIGAETKYSVKEYTGELTVAVKPVTKGYNSPEAATVTYTKAKLATPTNIAVNGYVLTWDAVEGATGYNVMFGNKEYEATTNTLTLTDEALVSGVESYDVKVQATAALEKNNSEFSDAYVVKYQMKVTGLKYNANVVSWDSLFGAGYYVVKVNSGAEIKVEGKNYAEVKLTKAGQNMISVKFVGSDKRESEYAFIYVEAYEYAFDTRGGEEMPSLYLAKGDKIVLQDAVKEGFEFAGWYDVIGGAKNNGKRIVEGTFEGNSATVIYAYWTGVYSVIEYVYDGGTLDAGFKETEKVYIGDEFMLATATSSDSSKVFGGWFSEPNCLGIQYTDQTGLSLITLKNAGEIKVYAGWVEIFSYKLIKNSQDVTKLEYSVSKGEGINYVTEVKVPATYTENGVTYPVTTVEINAFLNCPKLKKIELPDTITTVAESAFAGCSALNEIDVYHVEDEEDKIHTVYIASVNGALYARTTNNAELKYFPIAKGGEYEIPAIVTFGQEEKETAGGKELVDVELKITNIPQNAFKNTSLTKVIIPYTVTTVQRSAFEACEKLTEIVFTSTPIDEAEVALEIRKQAFYNCTALKTINFPARLARILNDNDVEGYSAFDGCTALEATNVEQVNSVVGKYTSSNGALVLKDGTYTNGKGETKTGNVLVYCPVANAGKNNIFTVENNIKAIGTRAFNLGDLSPTSTGTLANTKLTGIVISGSVEEIQSRAFFYLNKLTSIKFEGVESDGPLAIRERAFYYCTVVTEITLPENLKVLEAYSFGNTSKLVTVTLNSAIKEGEEGGFEVGAFGTVPTATTAATYNVTALNIGPKVGVIEVAGIFGQKLESITVDAQNESYQAENDLLYSKGLKKLLYAPNKLTAYEAPAGLEEVANGVFKSNTKIKEIHLGKNVKRIGDYAFAYCTALASVIIDGADQGETRAELVIGEYAFANTTYSNKLKTVSLPEGTTEIGNYALAFAIVENMYIPSTVTKLGDGNTNHVFYRNYYAKEFVVGEGNTNYKAIDGGLYGLDGNGNPTVLYKYPAAGSGKDGVVTVPETVTKVQEEAFYYLNKQVTTGAVVNKIVFTGEHENVEIGDYAFAYVNKAEEIVLPTGLQEIKANMFYVASALEKIEIPYTVKKIYGRAFYQCTKLTEITFAELPQGKDVADYPLEIGDAYGESLTAATGRVSISQTSSYGAFYYTTKLVEIAFPERTTRIGRFAFANCTALKKVTIPYTVTSIGAGAFYYCTALEEVIFTPLPDGKNASEYPLTFDDGQSIATAYRTSEGVYTPGAVTDSATASIFYNCPKLTKCDMPERTVKVGIYTFNNVAALSSMIFPSTLKEIGNYAFYGTSITEAVLNEGLTTIGANAFANNEALTKVVVPSTVTALGSAAFYRCTALTDLTFTDGETLLEVSNETGVGAFQATGVMDLVIPTRMVNVGENMFRACKELTAVTFADGSKVKEIGEGAFAQTGLKEFTFPETEVAVKLGEVLFEDCLELEKVVITKNVLDLNGVFKGCNSIAEISVDSENPNYSVNPTNKAMLLNKEETAIRNIFLVEANMVILDGIQELGDYAFENNKELVQITIPESMVQIGSHVFDGCTNLEKVTFAGENPALVKIGSYTFAGCSKLTEITLPNRVKTLGTEEIKVTEVTNNGKTTTTTEVMSNAGYVFNNCVSLTKVVLPNSLKILGSYTFAGCRSLTEITLPEGVETLGSKQTTSVSIKTGGSVETKPEEVTYVSYLFSNCTALKTVNLPETTLKQIGSRTFNKCNELVNVNIPESVEFIGKYAFYGCELVKEFKMPKFIETENIEERIFQNCFSLEKVDLNGLTTITDGMFYNCFALQTVVGIDNITAVKDYGFFDCYAFAGKDGDGYLDLSKVKEIGDKAFYFCCNLKEVVIGEGTKSIGSEIAQSGSCGVETTAEVDPNGPEMSPSFGGAGEVSTGTGSGVAVGDPGDINDGRTVGGPGFISGAGGSLAFYGCVKLEKVTLPESCKMINSGAFGECRALKEINLENVENIRNYAFENCNKLEKVDLSSLKEIGQYIFEKCASIKEANFVHKIEFKTHLGATDTNGYTFRDCTSLEKVTFNPQQNVIPTSMFQNCTALKVITFPGDKLNSDPATPYVSLPDLVTSLNASAFSGCTSIEHFNAPTVLTTNGSSVFEGCTSLKTATFNKDQAKFGTTYFRYCSSLELFDINAKITVPAAGSAMIATNMFRGCDSIVFTSSNEKFKIINGSVYSADEKTLYLAGNSSENFEFATNCTRIAAYAFSSSSAENVIVPQGFTIENYGFAYSNVKSVELPADMKMLGTKSSETATYSTSYMFYYAEKLEEVKLPENLEVIGGYAFDYCASLKHIDLPDTLKSIENTSFGYSGLEEIVLPESVTILGYKSSATTYDYYLSSSAFSNCKSLRKVTVSKNLENIGGNAFYQCQSLKVLTYEGDPYNTDPNHPVVSLPQTCLHMANAIFSDCSSIEEIVLPDGLTELGYYSSEANKEKGTLGGSSWFRNCSSLKKINIPETVTRIGSYTFQGCESLEHLDIPDSVTYIGNSVFQNSGFKEFTLKYYPDCGTASGFFRESTKLEKIVLEEGWEVLPMYTFYGCTALKEVVLPSTLKEIGNYVFAGCTSLETIVIPEGVTKIGSRAFEGCTALKKVVLPSTLERLAGDPADTSLNKCAMTFLGCTSLETIWLPKSITTLGNSAFGDCTSLKTIYVESRKDEINEGPDMPAWYNDGVEDWIDYLPKTDIGETRNIEVKYGYTYEQYLEEIGAKQD